MLSSLLGLPLEEALARPEAQGLPVVYTEDPHGHPGGTFRVIRADTVLVAAAFYDGDPVPPQT